MHLLIAFIRLLLTHWASIDGYFRCNSLPASDKVHHQYSCRFHSLLSSTAILPTNCTIPPEIKVIVLAVNWCYLLSCHILSICHADSSKHTHTKSDRALPSGSILCHVSIASLYYWTIWEWAWVHSFYDKMLDDLYSILILYNKIHFYTIYFREKKMHLLSAGFFSLWFLVRYLRILGVLQET